MRTTGSPSRLLLALGLTAATFAFSAGAVLNGQAPAPLTGTPLFFPQLAGPQNAAIAAGDLNGDGKADLVVGQ